MEVDGNDAEESEMAAIKIQECWRKSRNEQEVMALKALEISQWKGLTEITQHNDDLVKRLKEIQISKNYDVQKFQTLLRLPAKEVNSYLENEAKKEKDEQITEFDKIERTIKEEKKDQAARTLQRYFRKIQVHQKRDEYRNRILRIKPKRRIELLEQTNNRLNEKRNLKRIKADDVARALEMYRSKANGSKSTWMAKTEVDIRRHSLNLSRPNSPTRFLARSVSHLSKYKAKKLHEQRMKEIENETMIGILETKTIE